MNVKQYRRLGLIVRHQKKLFEEIENLANELDASGADASHLGEALENLNRSVESVQMAINEHSEAYYG